VFVVPKSTPTVRCDDAKIPDAPVGRDGAYASGMCCMPSVSRFRVAASKRLPLSPAAKDRLRRIVFRAPEAMVKVTGRARGGAVGLKAISTT
jgi:hypothetical protein